MTRPHSDQDRARPLYVISVAAELAGLHAQTLRSYERRGLVEPARTDGGDRRYSDDDLDRISRITELTDQGLNLTAIGRILELEAELDRLRTELDRTQRSTRAAVDAAHRAHRRDLVPTSQGLVPWRHPLDFSFPAGGA
jgi:MerR family transcriptional regulator, heat shock protein HspR